MFQVLSTCSLNFLGMECLHFPLHLIPLSQVRPPSFSPSSPEKMYLNLSSLHCTHLFLPPTTVHRCSAERTVSITSPWGLETSNASPGSREMSNILNLETSPSPPGSPVSAYPSFPLNLNGPATLPFFLLLDKHAVFNVQNLHMLFPYLEFSLHFSHHFPSSMFKYHFLGEAAQGPRVCMKTLY